MTLQNNNGVQSDNKETQPTQTNAQGMVGGLPDIKVGSPDPVQQQTQQPQQQTQSTPIYLGGKKFNNQEELIKYTSELEAQRQVQMYQQQTQVDQPQEKKLSDLLFEDTDKAVELIEQRAYERIKREESTQKQLQNVRDEFYSKYKDLKGAEDLVDYYAGRLAGQLNNASKDEQFERVASEVRARINSFRGQQAKVETVSTGSVGTLGSGGFPHDAPQPKTQAMDFISQVRKLQKRG